MTYTYEYPRPAVTVDIILFSLQGENSEILLIERKHDPYKACWALPGGFVEMDETLLESALRELKEETGIEGIGLKQFRTYGDPGRDPRGRTVSVMFYAMVDKSAIHACAGDDAASLQWFDIHKLPALAFDHRKVVAEACRDLLSESI